MAETTTIAPTHKVPVSLASGGVGVQLRTFDELYRYATMLADSAFVPKDMYQNVPNVMAAIQLGAEIGLQAMASVQNIAVINGRPSVWGDVQLAICQRSGIFDFEAFDETYSGKEFEDTYTATTVARRMGAAKPVTSSYSVADAKRAKLWGKSGSWTTNPGRMLKYRARAFALRDAFADVIKGLYSREEMEGVERDTIIGTPVAVQPTKSRAEQLVDQLKPTAALPEPVAPDPEPKTEAPEQEPEPKADEQIGDGELFQKLRRAYMAIPEPQRAVVRRQIGIGQFIDACKTMTPIEANDTLSVLEEAGAP